MFPGVFIDTKKPPAPASTPVDLAKRSLAGARLAQLNEYLVALCRDNGVTVAELRAKDNRRAMVAIRREFCQAARQQGFSLPTIGAALHKHHTTVLHLLKGKPRWIK